MSSPAATTPQHATRHRLPLWRRPLAIGSRSLLEVQVRACALSWFVLPLIALLLVVLSNFNFYAARWALSTVSLATYTGLWQGFSCVGAWLAAVICGAADAEDKTAFFVARLPISHGRIAVEKIFGAAAAALLGCALTLAMIYLGLKLAGASPFRVNRWILLDYLHHEKPGTYALMLLLFCAGLAAGAVLGRVIAAAFATGVIALLACILANLAVGRHAAAGLPDELWPLHIISAVLLVVAIFVMLRREAK